MPKIRSWKISLRCSKRLQAKLVADTTNLSISMHARSSIRNLARTGGVESNRETFFRMRAAVENKLGFLDSMRFTCQGLKFPKLTESTRVEPSI